MLERLTLMLFVATRGIKTKGSQSARQLLLADWLRSPALPASPKAATPQLLTSA
jgi:hypothetical protein